MAALSFTVVINPPGEAQPLTREQVWKGLLLKAADASRFVPGMENCVVLKRWEDGLLREIFLGGEKRYEQITFTEPIEVLFERVGTNEWITNTLSDSDEGLLLTFSYSIAVPEKANAAEALRRMSEQYKEALRNTLATVRQLAAEGKFQ